MPNKFDQIADNKKKAALAKQDEDVERFAKKVAGEVLGGIGDLSLKDSVAEFATSVAQAVVLSNETLDASLKDNFSQLLSAVKDNKPDDTSQIELSKKIGKSLANIEEKIDDSKLSPAINLTALSQEELRTELGTLLARLPQDSQRIVTVAYENATADKYLNVRLTDGMSFYRASGGGGGGSSSGLTDAQLRASPVDVNATLDTTGLATEAKQDATITAVQGINTQLRATPLDVDTGLAQPIQEGGSVTVTGGATSAKQDTIIGHIDGMETLLGTIDVDTGNIDANAGATGDAASSVGGTGTISAKLRLITSQLNAIDGNTNGIETLLVAIASYVDDLESLVGTSNTKLDTLHADVDGLEGIATAIDGHVDGIETLVAATNTALATIDGRVDGVETLLTAIDSHVDGIEGSVDGVETLIGTTNTTLTTIDSRVDGLETSTSSIDTKTPSLGQALAAASTPVVLTAAQEAALTPPAAITGFATSAKQDTLLAELQLKADLTETQPVSLASVPTHAVTQSGTWTEANSAAIKTAVETLDNAIAGSEMQVDVVGALPAGTNAIGKLAANSGVDIGDVDVTSLPVAFNAGTTSATTQRTIKATGSTSTQTQVADSASSQTILAANTGRIRATIVNDSTTTLYLRESSSAATTSVYTYKMYPDETVIIDDYNGALTGIWSANASGNAIISEVTA